MEPQGYNGAQAGRGILRLHAPPKLARVPAPRRLLPRTYELPMPQWALTVSVAPPSVSDPYRAPTPVPVTKPDRHTPSLSQDAYSLGGAAGLRPDLTV